MVTDLCRWTATLQKARRIAESHMRYPTLRGAVQSVCIHVYLELGESLYDAPGYHNSMCTMLFCNVRTAQMLLLNGLGIPQVAPLNVCM